METAQRQLGVSGLSSNLVTSGWQESGNDEPSPHFGLFYLGYNINQFELVKGDTAKASWGD